MRHSIKYSLVCSIFLFLECCTKESPNFILVNNSKKTYDNIEIYTTISAITSLTGVGPNQIRKGKIPFDDDFKDDGCYKIVLYQKSKVIQSTCFGYYSNGKSLNGNFTITIIENDSIIVE